MGVNISCVAPVDDDLYSPVPKIRIHEDLDTPSDLTEASEVVCDIPTPRSQDCKESTAILTNTPVDPNNAHNGCSLDLQEVRAKVLSLPNTNADTVHPTCVFLQAAEVARIKYATQDTQNMLFTGRTSHEETDDVVLSISPHSVEMGEEENGNKCDFLLDFQSPAANRNSTNVPIFVSNVDILGLESTIVMRSGISQILQTIDSDNQTTNDYYPDNISEGNASIPESQATTVNNGGMHGSPFSDNTSLASLSSRTSQYITTNTIYGRNEETNGSHINGKQKSSPYQSNSTPINLKSLRYDGGSSLTIDITPEMEGIGQNHLDRTQKHHPLSNNQQNSNSATLLGEISKDTNFQLVHNTRHSNNNNSLANNKYNEPIASYRQDIEYRNAYNSGLGPLVTKGSYGKGIIDGSADIRAHGSSSTLDENLYSGSTSSGSSKMSSNIDSHVLNVKPGKKMTVIRRLKKTTSAVLRAARLKPQHHHSIQSHQNNTEWKFTQNI